MNSVEYMTPAQAEKIITAYWCLVRASINIPTLSSSSPVTYTFRALNRENTFWSNALSSSPLASAAMKNKMGGSDISIYTDS